MSDQSHKKRIWATLGAVIFSRGIRFAEQIILVPLFLSAWGIAQYGEWIALTAIAQLAYFTQFGIGAAGASDIIINAAANDHKKAATSLGTALASVTATIAIVTLLSAVFMLFADWTRWVNLRTMSASEATDVVLMIGTAILLGFYVTPIAAVTTASLGAAPSNYIAATTKALELTAIGAALLLGATPVRIAIISLVSAIVTLVTNIVFARIHASWLSIREIQPDMTSLKKTIKPSLGYFLMLVSMSGLNVYVPRLMIFSAFGAEALSVFTVLVTYARAPRTLANVIAFAIQAEIGRAFGANNLPRLASLIQTLGQLSFFAGVLMVTGALSVAYWVVPIWTHGKIHVEWPLLFFLSIGSLVGILADALLFAAAGLNLVLAISLWYLLGYGLGLSVGGLGMNWSGPAALAAGLILPELFAIWFGSSILSRLVTDQTPGRMVLGAITPPSPANVRRLMRRNV